MNESLFGALSSEPVEISEPKRKPRSEAEQNYIDMEASNRAGKIISALHRHPNGDDLMRGIAAHLFQHVNNNKGGSNGR